MKINFKFCLILLFALIVLKSYSQIPEVVQKETAVTKSTVYMVSDAHLDTQWDWDVQTTISQYLKNTLNDNFALFKKYPNYKFNFEGAIKYMWFKEYYPELYAQLKTYVASGQWNIAGSSLDAIDVIVPSPESQFRNILIGQTFYKKEFGKKGKDIFLPDCFGFGYTLPTITKHAGLIGFCTQKLSWGGVITPFKIGVWQGVDGSKILAAADAGDYGHKYDEDLSYNTELINWSNETSTKTGGKYPIAYRLYGTGDRGGSPDDNSVNSVERGIAGNGPLTIKSAASSDMYDDYTPFMNDFPHYNGELIMTTHGTGCYTSRTFMKRMNRKNELLADASERSAVIADWLGGLTYPASELNNAWIKLIWHQFHDDLTGTSCTSAYTFSQNDEVICQNKFASILKNTVGAGVRSLNTQAEGTPIVVYNPLSISREDVVEVNLKVAAKTDFIKVFNKSGVEVPSQVIMSNDSLVKFIFTATVKSLGYEVYDARPSSVAPANDATLKITTNSLENSNYAVAINANGDISSIIDKSNGNKQLLSSPIRLALLKNDPCFWASWEIAYSTVNTAPRAYVDGKPTISIEEKGPVRVTLKISRTKENSTFVQYIRLTNTDTKKRIDVENDVNWKIKKTLLKAVFPMTASNTNATYDLGIGVIKRPNNSSIRYEVPAQQWADITSSDNSYGVSILNDCKYGWDKPTNSTLRLSLIHSPQSDGGSYKFQENQDLGNNKFTYSIYGHTNTCLEAGSTWEAAKLNQPLMAFEALKHDGALGKSFSLLNIESSQVALKTFKKSELNNDYVVRFYETKGTSATDVKIKFASRIIDAKELNGIEEEIGAATFSDSILTISMTAFQPKTYSVRLAPPVTALTAPESKPMKLTYNVDVVSTQSNMAYGNFDGQSNSFAAELLPDTIFSDGIKFAIGPKTDQKLNAVKCSGNKITIPSGYKKIYILAASSNKNGSIGNFYVDKQVYKLNIPYFSNFVGQGSVYNFIGGDTVITNNYFKPENIAWVGDHMHNGNSKTDKPYIFTYLFKYCIELPAGATQLILPNNTSIAVFAVTAANNENDDTKPSSEFMEIQKPEEVPLVTTTHCGDNLSELKTATASGQCSSTETPSKAIDGDESTKWCFNNVGDKWLVVDLGKPMQICEWRVKHAGIESENYITKDFKLQKMVGTQWVDVDAVTGNVLNTTDRLLTPFIAQKIRLYITNSGNDDAARIYEFQVFGSINTDVKDVVFAEKVSLSIYPNPISTQSFNIQLSGFNGENNLVVSMKDVSGREVYQSTMINATTLSLTLNDKMCNGLYFVNVKGKHTAVNGKLVICNLV